MSERTKNPRRGTVVSIISELAIGRRLTRFRPVRTALTSARFIPPMLPSLVVEPPTGGHWIYEVKHDGYRTLLLVDGGQATAITRNRNDWTSVYPGIVAAASRLKCRSAIVDGEVIFPDSEGRSDFHGIRTAIGNKGRGCRVKKRLPRGRPHMATEVHSQWLWEAIDRFPEAASAMGEFRNAPHVWTALRWPGISRCTALRSVRPYVRPIGAEQNEMGGMVCLRPGGGAWYSEMIEAFGDPDHVTPSELRQCAMDPPTSTTVLLQNSSGWRRCSKSSPRSDRSRSRGLALSHEELDAIIAEEEQSRARR